MFHEDADYNTRDIKNQDEYKRDIKMVPRRDNWFDHLPLNYI